MAKFYNEIGIWIVYDLDSTYNIDFYSEDPISVITHVSNRGYGQIAFWPTDMSIDTGINWWNEKSKNYLDDRKQALEVQLRLYNTYIRNLSKVVDDAKNSG